MVTRKVKRKSKKQNKKISRKRSHNRSKQRKQRRSKRGSRRRSKRRIKHIKGGASPEVDRLEKKKMEAQAKYKKMMKKEIRQIKNTTNHQYANFRKLVDCIHFKNTNCSLAPVHRSLTKKRCDECMRIKNAMFSNYTQIKKLLSEYLKINPSDTTFIENSIQFLEKLDMFLRTYEL